MIDEMVQVTGLKKRFGKTVALQSINLSVPTGSILGVLGPNGAGKTTTIHCLTTLLRPDGGRATIAGYDVLTEPSAVRALIGVTGQFTALDKDLTVQENLTFFGRLLRLPIAQTKQRVRELLAQFELDAVALQPVKALSGGMRRRLDLAISIVTKPLVLFLDEPTTGLDPRSRRQVWDMIRALKKQGITIFLTTQYLEEVDELADRIVVIDRGRVIADGTVDDLKNRVGDAFCELRLSDPQKSLTVKEALADLGEVTGTSRLTIPAPNGVGSLMEILQRMEAIGVELTDVALRRPSLDDVFFSLTKQSFHYTPVSHRSSRIGES
jgi:ABC-2 type transport system ATP-binding protein